MLGDRRTLERRFEARSSGRSVAIIFTERSVQSSRKDGSFVTPLQVQEAFSRPGQEHFWAKYLSHGIFQVCAVRLIQAMG